MVLAEELSGYSIIDNIQLLCGSTTYNHGVFYNHELYLCHTSFSQLTPTFVDNYDGNLPELVRHDDSVDLNWTNEEWEDLLFDTSFAYNGMDNLIIEWRWLGDEGEDVYVRGWYPPGGNRVLDGSSVGGTTGLLRNYMNRLRVRFWKLELTGDVAAGQVTLTWDAVPGTQEYWVYGASNMPYFAPGFAPDYEHRVAQLPGTATTWSSTGGIGDPSNNWTYLIISVDGTDQELLRSNRLGEFDCDVPAAQERISPTDSDTLKVAERRAGLGACHGEAPAETGVW